MKERWDQAENMDMEKTVLKSRYVMRVFELAAQFISKMERTSELRKLSWNKHTVILRRMVWELEETEKTSVLLMASESEGKRF